MMENTQTKNVRRTIFAFFKETVPEIFAVNPELREELKDVVQFRVEGENGGEWFIDTEHGQAVPGTNPQAICTIVAKADKFATLLEGPLREWIAAYLTGELQLKGNLVRALRIRRLFERYSA